MELLVFAMVAIAMTVHGQNNCKVIRDLATPCNVRQEKDGATKPCQFPFVWKDRIFYGCTTFLDPDDKAWCSTATDEDHQHLSTGQE